METHVVSLQPGKDFYPIEGLCQDLRSWLHAIFKIQKDILSERHEDDSDYSCQLCDCFEKEMKSMIHRMTDVIDVYQMGRCEVPAIVDVIDVGVMAEYCKEFFHFVSRGKQLSFTCMGSVEGKYLGDEKRIRQMLFNVIENAVTYNRLGGSVQVKMFQQKMNETYHRFTVSVRDTGVGMTEEQKEKLFQPFARLERTHTGEYRRAGVGLSVAKYIVESLSGSLELKSEPYAGTEVTLVFLLEHYRPVK